MKEIYVPRENVNDEEVIVLKVYCNNGDYVEHGDIVVDIETSKTNISVISPEAGVVYHNLKEKLEVKVGSVLFRIASESDIDVSASVKSELIVDLDASKKVLSQKAAEKVKELGISIDQFGEGWITTKDIERHIDGTNELVAKNICLNPVLDLSPSDLSVSNTVHKLSMRKRAEITNLEVGNHFATTSTIGISITVFGERLVLPHPLFKEGITDLVVYETAKLLKQYSTLNASYLGDSMWAAYNEINFGWSFDNGNNLKVLSVKSADKLSLTELQSEVMRLLEMYESGESIPMDLLLSSTVTISDLSRSEASFILPLINGKQSLILGIAKADKNIFNLYASFDHRISEGAEVAKFLTEVKHRVLSYFDATDGVALINCCACDKPMSEEIALGHRGFTKLILKDGAEGAICRNCFDGW